MKTHHLCKLYEEIAKPDLHLNIEANNLEIFSKKQQDLFDELDYYIRELINLTLASKELNAKLNQQLRYLEENGKTNNDEKSKLSKAAGEPSGSSENKGAEFDEDKIQQQLKNMQRKAAQLTAKFHEINQMSQNLEHSMENPPTELELMMEGLLNE